MTGTLVGMPSREPNNSKESDQDPAQLAQGHSPDGKRGDMHKLGASTQTSGTSDLWEGFGRDGLDFKSSGTMVSGTNPFAATSIAPLLRSPRRSGPFRVRPQVAPPKFEPQRRTTVAKTANRRGSRQLLLLLLGIAVSVSLGASFAIVTKESPVVKVINFAIDAEGRDRLIVACPSCTDGSRIRLEKTWSVLNDQQASVFPEEKLQIGPNHLQFEIETLEGRHLDAKAITLPVAFRLTTQWLRPTGRGPEAIVQVEAPPKSRVKINDEETLLTAGLATKTFLYDKETTGNAPQVESLSLTLDVAVTSGDQTQHATTTLRSGVCPLVAEVTYEEAETGFALIRGKTAPDARVLVAGSQVEIGPHGRFEHRLNLQNRGPISVVASTSELLPRNVVLALQ